MLPPALHLPFSFSSGVITALQANIKAVNLLLGLLQVGVNYSRCLFLFQELPILKLDVCRQNIE